MTTNTNQKHHLIPTHGDLPISATTVVLYHANCNDGFGAAWAIWSLLGSTDVEYIPVSYGKPIPDQARQAKSVYIVDFSYPRQQLEELNREVSRLTVIDHHATAEKDLDGLPFAYFDQQKSGAVLTWEFIHPNEPVPELLLYVEDRDLWRWRLEDSREINEALMATVERDFDQWQYLNEHWKTGEKGTLAADGALALRIKESHVFRLIEKPAWLEIDGHIVPAVNSPMLQSELGEALCRRWDSPFAATWCVRADGTSSFSLRSRPRLVGLGNRTAMSEGALTEHTHDCAATAEKFGGGGHKQAGGFETDVGFVFHDRPATTPDDWKEALNRRDGYCKASKFASKN